MTVEVKDIFLALLANPKCYHPAGSPAERERRMSECLVHANALAEALHDTHAEVGDDGPVDHDSPGG